MLGQFYLGTQLLPDSQTYDFPSKESAICSPLAMRIFEVDGVKSAFFSSTYIAINKVGSCLFFACFGLSSPRLGW
jgi:hypothetical protein